MQQRPLFTTECIIYLFTAPQFDRHISRSTGFIQMQQHFWNLQLVKVFKMTFILLLIDIFFVYSSNMI